MDCLSPETCIVLFEVDRSQNYFQLMLSQSRGIVFEEICVVRILLYDDLCEVIFVSDLHHILCMKKNENCSRTIFSL